MKKPYKHIRLKQKTQEWIDWRQENGLGGSEVTSALATDSKELSELVYMTPIQLHLLKLGEPVQKFMGNESSCEGQFQEPHIIERFKYYDLESPNQMSIYSNMEAGNKINGVYQPGDILQNPKYPWLFYSLDAFMTDSITSKKPKALIEAKLTTSMESNRYENSVNPAHWLQLQTGLMITGFPIGYLITMVDGKWFKVLPVEPDKQIHEWIEHITVKFWTNVVKAKIIKVEYELSAYYNVNPDTLTERQREGVQLLSDLEPSLIGSEHEIDFIKSMIIPQAEEFPREGTQEELDAVRSYLLAGEQVNEFDRKKKIHYAQMISTLNGSNVINFNDGKDGYYSFKANKNGKPALYVSPKLKTDEVKV
jgi:hypothetical protein